MVSALLNRVALSKRPLVLFCLKITLTAWWLTLNFPLKSCLHPCFYFNRNWAEHGNSIPVPVCLASSGIWNTKSKLWLSTDFVVIKVVQVVRLVLFRVECFLWYRVVQDINS